MGGLITPSSRAPGLGLGWRSGGRRAGPPHGPLPTWGRASRRFGRMVSRRPGSEPAALQHGGDDAQGPRAGEDASGNRPDSGGAAADSPAKPGQPTEAARKAPRGVEWRAVATSTVTPGSTPMSGSLAWSGNRTGPIRQADRTNERIEAADGLGGAETEPQGVHGRQGHPQARPGPQGRRFRGRLVVAFEPGLAMRGIRFWGPDPRCPCWWRLYVYQPVSNQSNVQYLRYCNSVTTFL